MVPGKNIAGRAGNDIKFMFFEEFSLKI